MSDEVTDHEEDATGVDEASLAGMSEYSATGGGYHELHVPRLEESSDAIDEPEIPDASSFRELYRYSLGRATQDAHGDGGRGSEEGPLHLVERRSSTKKR